MVLAFMVGAVVGAAVVERSKQKLRAHYAWGLWLEAVALSVVAGASFSGRFRLPGAELILLLCWAMGLQNAMITRLSGAVVRTTHVTGIVTDVGIELVHLWMLLGERARGRFRLLSLREVWSDPAVDPLKLHCTLWCSFVGGNLLGAALFLRFGFASLLLPIAVVSGLAVFDQRSGLDLPAGTPPAPQPTGR
jgi:uncharacterized membrane protein YoaK (UPF0700 family)